MDDILGEYFNSVLISYWGNKGITKEELEQYNAARCNYLYFKKEYEVAKTFYEEIRSGLDSKYGPFIEGGE